MALTDWTPEIPPILGTNCAAVSMRNDVYHLRWEFVAATAVSGPRCMLDWTLTSAQRISEAHKIGIPMQSWAVASVGQANTTIRNLLVEARRLDNNSAAFVVVEVLP